MLYVFEGLDGSGKSTLMRKVKRELVERGWDVLTIREPDDECREQVCYTNKQLGIEDQANLMEDCHNMLMDRVKDFKGIILSDRSFLYSSLVYQTTTIEDQERKRNEYLSKYDHPHKTFILTTEPDICRYRALGPREDEVSTFDADPLEVYETRYNKYMNMKDYKEVVFIDCDCNIDYICDMITLDEEF